MFLQGASVDDTKFTKSFFKTHSWASPRPIQPGFLARPGICFLTRSEADFIHQQFGEATWDVILHFLFCLAVSDIFLEALQAWGPQLVYP